MARNSAPLTDSERKTMRDLMLRDQRAERAAREADRLARLEAFQPIVPLIEAVPLDQLDALFDAALEADVDADSVTRLHRLRQILTYDLRSLNSTLTMLNTPEAEIDEAPPGPEPEPEPAPEPEPTT